MGLDQTILTKLLQVAGFRITQRTLPRLQRGSILRSPYESEIRSVYGTLGGHGDGLEFRLGEWDIEVDGVALEFDEFLHFNRYRLMTLESKIYEALHAFPHRMYKNYCEQYEARCVKAGSFGARWSSTSAERQFGTSGPPRVLEGSGSARWRQRAFYDFLKDLTPLVFHVPLVRLAVWDSVVIKGRRVQLADVRGPDAADALECILRLIEARRLLTDRGE